MPQQNYNLTSFDWDRSLENLRESKLIVGDLTDEEIGRTKSVLNAHIKVENDKVSFSLSQYGSLQISHANNQSLTRARSQLKNLIVCLRWVPKEEPSIGNSELPGEREKGLLKNRIIEIIEELRDYELYRSPERYELMEEVCVRLGSRPDEDLVLEALRDLGWRKPLRPGDYVKAKRERAKYLILAAKMKYTPNSDEIMKASEDDVKKARYVLENHPDWVPEIRHHKDTGELGFIWPEYVWNSDLIGLFFDGLQEIILYLPDDSQHLGIKEGSSMLQDYVSLTSEANIH